MTVLPELVACPRLALRRWEARDAALLSAAIGESIEHLRPWMPFIAYEPLSIEARAGLISGWEANWQQGGDFVFGIFLEGVVVGVCGPNHRSTPDTREIGYMDSCQLRRRGFAREAAAELTATALAQPGIARVEIHHDAANTASRRVPESLGFQLDGETPDTPAAPSERGIDVCWSTTCEAWRHPSTR